MGKKSDIRGKTAIVTGGAGGIGFEFAKELARRGCNLVLIDLSEPRLIQAFDELRRMLADEREFLNILTLTLDLSEENIIGKIDSFCKENDVEPDILINNAGIFSFAPVTETNTHKTELFVDLHVRAVTLLSQWFCGLREKKGNGWLLNMSSMSCWMPMPGLALYASTKSYIRVFSRSLHYEMRDSGVEVMVACPGGIATDLFGLPENLKKFAVRIGVLDTPERFVSKALNKLLKGRKQYINGWLNRFSIFFVAVLPTGVRMMVKHKLLDKGIKR